MIERGPARILLTRMILLTAAAAVAAACVGSSVPGGPRPGDEIVAEELATVRATDVVEAIRRLRPTWLSNLGGVFVDEVPVSGVEELRTIDLRTVVRIERLTAADVATRWSVPSSAGRYLHVTTRRRSEAAAEGGPWIRG